MNEVHKCLGLISTLDLDEFYSYLDDSFSSMEFINKMSYMLGYKYDYPPDISNHIYFSILFCHYQDRKYRLKNSDIIINGFSNLLTNNPSRFHIFIGSNNHDYYYDFSLGLVICKNPIDGDEQVIDKDIINLLYDSYKILV